MADDRTLAKVLFYDIVRQLRVSAGISSVDAANCYDSIAHAIASLVLQAFGVPEKAIETMLTEMKKCIGIALDGWSHGLSVML